MDNVSVIIPTWNRAETIPRAIKSALSQTLPPLEILVCDDGSTDKTYEIIKSLSSPKVRWISNQHTGLPAVPRNRGIKEANGEWLAFLDSDDEWLPNRLKTQLEIAEKNNSKVVVSNAYRFVLPKGIVGNLLDWNKDKLTFSDLIKENKIICSSVLIQHASLFTKVFGFPENKNLRAIEDYALWLRVATQTDFAYISEPLLIYHDDPQASIRNETKINFAEQKKYVFQDFLNWSKRQKDLEKYAKMIKKTHLSTSKTIFQNYLINIFQAFKKNENSSYS